jgi:predicted aspartyl protease
MTSAIKNLGLSFLFLCCAGTAHALVSAPAPEPGNSVPVRMLRGYLMVVGVSIEDHGPFDFLVDTGTNSTLLDPELAVELKLVPQDRLQLASLSGSTSVPRYFLPKIKAGPAALSNLEALAMPLPQLKLLDGRIRGILGMNFLLHFSFRLDFEHTAMELYPFPETAHIPAGLRVPVEINESRLLIAVASTAAPGGSWRLALDSGISQFLVFQDRLAPQDANERCASSNCLMQVSTNLSQQAASTRLLHDLSISEALLPEQEIVVLRNDQQKPADPQDGLLPAAPFHSVFFDRSTATIIFSPTPAGVSVAALEAR